MLATPLHVSALREYNEAVAEDGVSAQTWLRIAAQLKAAYDLDGLTGDRREFVRARAVDAAQRAQYMQRMVKAAQTSRVIEVQP